MVECIHQFTTPLDRKRGSRKTYTMSRITWADSVITPTKERIPMSTGISTTSMALKIKMPMPFQWKTNSITKLPTNTKGRFNSNLVRTGRIAFLATW